MLRVHLLVTLEPLRHGPGQHLVQQRVRPPLLLVQGLGSKKYNINKIPNYTKKGLTKHAWVKSNLYQRACYASFTYIWSVAYNALW